MDFNRKHLTLLPNLDLNLGEMLLYVYKNHVEAVLLIKIQFAVHFTYVWRLLLHTSVIVLCFSYEAVPVV